MAGYRQFGDVRTWYDERGQGEPLVMLPPGTVDARPGAEPGAAGGVTLSR